MDTTIMKNPFEYQKPTEKQVQLITAFRDNLKMIYNDITLLKESRERSLAITKLEEVSMWINKHIVFNEE